MGRQQLTCCLDLEYCTHVVGRFSLRYDTSALSRKCAAEGGRYLFDIQPTAMGLTSCLSSTAISTMSGLGVDARGSMPMPNRAPMRPRSVVMSVPSKAIVGVMSCRAQASSKILRSV